MSDEQVKLTQVPKHCLVGWRSERPVTYFHSPSCRRKDRSWTKHRHRYSTNNDSVNDDQMLKTDQWTLPQFAAASVLAIYTLLATVAKVSACIPDSD